MNTPTTLSKAEWLDACLKELVAAGFNDTPGLRGYANDLYSESLSPAQAVQDALSTLE